jgi:hypothetical protein
MAPPILYKVGLMTFEDDVYLENSVEWNTLMYDDSFLFSSFQKSLRDPLEAAESKSKSNFYPAFFFISIHEFITEANIDSSRNNQLEYFWYYDM